MTRYAMILDRALPPSLNELLRMHYRKAAQLKKTYETLLAYNGGNKIPKAHKGEHRRVAIELFKGPHGKRDDPTNLDGRAKLILDAMTKLGLIYDDDAAHLSCEVREHAPHADRKTVIEITIGGK